MEYLDQTTGHFPRGLYTYHPVVVSRARGSTVWDEEGRALLDFTSGLGVLHLGHCHPLLQEAMVGQIKELVHVCSHVMHSRPSLELACRLNALVPIAGPCKTFFCNSGAEAVENAVKIARYATGRRAVVAFHGGYHGRTSLCSSLTGRARPYRKGFSPLASDVFHVPYPYCYRCAWGLSRPDCGLRCLQALDRLFLTECPADEVAAVILEPVQGEGGVVVPPDEFIARLQDLCRNNGILLVADEVQTGLARTGMPFAMQHFGAEPDLAVLGKALGGGLPLASVTGREAVMESVHQGGLGSTFGGNPVSCAAGLRLLQILWDEDLHTRAREIQMRFFAKAMAWEETFSWVGEVRGRGAMLGIELVKGKDTREPAPAETRRVVRRCFEKGLLLLWGGLHRNVIRLLPSLNIPWDELETGLDVLENCLRELASSFRGGSD
ncbi:MAG: aspartate aminotransferase family protein [Thermodesulfobacteriota bacterium]